MASHFKTESEHEDEPDYLLDENRVDLLIPEDTSMDGPVQDLRPGEVFGTHKKHGSRHQRSRMRRMRRSRRVSSGGRRRHHHRHHHHHRRRVWPRVLAVFLLLFVVAAGIEGFLLFNSVRTVQTHAKAAVSNATGYVSAAKSGDAQKLKESAQGVSDAAHSLKEELSKPEWTVATYVPVYGSDVTSVRTMSSVLEEVSDEALIPLAEKADILSLSKLMENSAVNLEALGHVTKAVETVALPVAHAAEEIGSLPTAHIPQVSEVLERVRGTIVDANNVLEHATPLLGHLPSLLGENGQQKQYLVLAGNIAEVHAVGGFVGFVGKLQVQDGHIELSDFENLLKLLPYSKSAGATKEEIALFGDRANTHSGDHNVIPDYSRAGQLYFNHWKEAQNEELDGVLSFDTVFLQRILGLVGGIDTSFGVKVDGTNAARVTLNECLYWPDHKTVDEFYREVADKAMDKFLDNLGSVDTPEFLKTVVELADQGRCIGWIHDKETQKAMVEAGFAWELPHDATKPMLGVFMNDYMASKCSYYMSIDTTVGEAKQNEDGSKTYAVKTTFKYNAPRSMLDEGRKYYLVPNSSEKDGTFLRLGEEVCLVAPEGGKIENVQTTYSNLLKGSRSIDWYPTSYQGLGMWKCDMHIDVSEQCDVTYEVTTSPEAAEELVVRQTPVVPHEVRGD